MPNKDNDPKKTAGRKARQQRRIPENAGCLTCGENSQCAMEWHHTAGFAHDPNQVALTCKNCHAKATAGQIQEGVLLEPASGLLERIVAQLESLAAWFRTLGDAFDRTARQLRAFIARLKEQFPQALESLEEGAQS